VLTGTREPLEDTTVSAERSPAIKTADDRQVGSACRIDRLDVEDTIEGELAAAIALTQKYESRRPRPSDMHADAQRTILIGGGI
jgi:hypothetical protein